MTQGKLPLKIAGLPRVKLPKAVRNAGISAGILVLLFLVAGVSYTWYMDQQAGQTIASLPVSNTTTDETPIRPVQPAANAAEGAAVETINSPVAAGEDTSIIVQTNPTSTCTINVTYGNVTDTNPALTSKTADAYGAVSWDWTVKPGIPPGTYPVKVTCSYHGRTGVVIGDLQVTK